MRQNIASRLEHDSLEPEIYGVYKRRKAMVERRGRLLSDTYSESIEELDIVLDSCLWRVEGLKAERERLMRESYEVEGQRRRKRTRTGAD